MKVTVASQFVALQRSSSRADAGTFEGKLKERQEEPRLEKAVATATPTSTSATAARALAQRSLELTATQLPRRVPAQLKATQARLVSSVEKVKEPAQFRVSDLFRGIVKP